MKDDYPTYYPRTPRSTQSLWIWALLLFAAFVAGLFLGSTADAETTTGPLEPASGTWRAYRGSGFTTFVCSANSEAAVMACAAADAERRATTTRYQLRYPNRYGMVSYFVPAPPAPVDCVVSAWSEWSGGTWSVCVNGYQSRTEERQRTILTQPARGGAACPALTEPRAASRQCTIAGTASLSWTAPTRNTDNSALTNLAGYRVHYGRTATELVRTLEIDSPVPVSAVIADLAAGAWYFCLRAVATSGATSACSAVATKVVN